MATVNPVGGSGTNEARDAACTPKWVAELIGRVMLDPCSNDRSHIDAEFRCILDWGGDGLDEEGLYPGSFWGAIPWPQDGTSLDETTGTATATWETFINPPYARGQVIRWVRHYRHTRFIFLLRWDPRTKWFDELYDHCTHVWFPRMVGDGTGNTVDNHPGRIEFEPPPGVTFSSNPFPHALYLRDPDPGLLERLAPHGRILRPDQIVIEDRDGEETPARGREQPVVPQDARGGGAGCNSEGKSRRGGAGVSRSTRWCRGCEVVEPADGDGAYCSQCRAEGVHLEDD